MITMANWKDNLIKIEPYVAGEQPAKKDFIISMQTKIPTLPLQEWQR